MIKNMQCNKHIYILHHYNTNLKLTRVLFMEKCLISEITLGHRNTFKLLHMWLVRMKKRLQDINLVQQKYRLEILLHY